MDEIFTKDWAQELVKDLSEVSSVSTQEEVLSILQHIAIQLDDFLGNFNRLRTQVELMHKRTSLVKTYRRVTSFSYEENSFTTTLDDQRTNAEELALYQQILQQMVLGYYLLNKVRDVFFERITYAIGFINSETKSLQYVENLELEDLLTGTLSLSTRIRISQENFARLEIDLKEVIAQLQAKGKVKNAEDDPLYKQILAYTSVNKHTYYNRAGQKREKPFQSGHLWETYRYMKLNNIAMEGRNIHTYYEMVRRGNLIYTKGGDVLSEQDKYGKEVALTSMATIVQQLPLLIDALRASSAQQVYEKLSSVFLQELTDTTDEFLRDYILKDREKLLALLKLPAQ